MSVNILRVLMLGNLLFFFVEAQLNYFTTQNIYIPASLLLNMILLFEITKITKIPVTYNIFFLASLVGVFTSYYVIGFSDFLIISVKFLWIFTSVILVNHLIRSVKFSQVFEELRKFAIFTGYLLLGNFLLSALLVDGAYIVNQGLETYIISSGNAKKLALFVLPFFFLSTKRNLIFGIILLLFLLITTRALILSAVFIFIFSSIYYLRKPSNKNFFSKFANTLLIVSVLGSSVLIVNSARSIEFTNFLSSIDRVVIWSQYSQVIMDYPMGLGPEGAFYFLRKNPTRAGTELSSFVNLLQDQEVKVSETKTIDNLVQKRIAVNTDLDTKSSESLFLDFVGSFGIIGFLFLLYLFSILIRDLRRAISFSDLEFSTIYAALSANLIYGFFNSYHSGMLFIILFCITYLVLRKNITLEQL